MTIKWMVVWSPEGQEEWMACSCTPMDYDEASAMLHRKASRQTPYVRYALARMELFSACEPFSAELSPAEVQAMGEGSNG